MGTEKALAHQREGKILREHSCSGSQYFCKEAENSLKIIIFIGMVWKVDFPSFLYCEILKTFHLPVFLFSET